MTFAAFGLCCAARADNQAEADAFCTRASRNHAIFELLLVDQVAHPKPVAGSAACTWSFGRVSSAAGAADLELKLETALLRSEVAAKQSIVLALLPENRRGMTVEALPRMGDGGVLRTATADGAVRAVEIEAVKGRRRFLLTVRPRPGLPSYRLAGQSVNFLGIGLNGL